MWEKVTTVVRRMPAWQKVVAVVVAVAVIVVLTIQLVSAGTSNTTINPGDTLKVACGAGSPAMHIEPQSPTAANVFCDPVPTTTTTVATTTTVPATTTTTTPPPPSTGMLTDVYRQWPNGPDPTGDPSYFPIGVWYQSADRTENGVANAVTYKNLGINVDVRGYDIYGVSLTDNSEFVSAGWTCWCEVGGTGTDGLLPPYAQITYTLSHSVTSGYIKGNFMTDEPDMIRVNCTPFCPLLQPTGMQTEGADIRAADPSRPTYANYGKGFSEQWWADHWQNQTGSWRSDMDAYCSAVDIVSSDVYGWTDPYETPNGAYVYGATVDFVKGPKTADTGSCPGKPYYSFIETGHPFQGGGQVNGTQIQQAVWDAIVHGANGIIYFAADFPAAGGYIEDGLLTTSAANAPAVQQVNAQIAALAPVLNTPSSTGQTVTSTGGVPITTMLKVSGGHTYLFAIADGNPNLPLSGATTGTFTVPGGFTGNATVLNESRTVAITGGSFTDNFAPYQLHVYQIG